VSYGLLFLRVVIGLVFFAHGSQKLLGWFGGSGLKGTRDWLDSMNFRLPAVMALMVAVSESSGLLFALGLLTPFAALLMTSAMFVAVASVHWKNGFFNGAQGFEFNLSLIAAAVAVSATGPGRFSLDRLIGWDDNLGGLWWGVGVLVAAALGAALTLTTMRRRRVPSGLGA
jgi:putative oxidoreductase